MFSVEVVVTALFSLLIPNAELTPPPFRRDLAGLDSLELRWGLSVEENFRPAATGIRLGLTIASGETGCS